MPRNDLVIHSGAGLHQGLATLCRAGVPPKLLIVDDGWQMTDVDRKFREPPTTRMVKEQEMLRQMFKDMNLDIENSSDEYLEAQVQLLYRGLKDIAPSSSIGAYPSPGSLLCQQLVLWEINPPSGLVSISALHLRYKHRLSNH